MFVLPPMRMLSSALWPISWLLAAFGAAVVAGRLIGWWLARRDTARSRRGVGMRSCARGLTGSTPRCWPVTISSASTVTIRRAYETEGGRFVIRVRLKEQTGHREGVELPAVPRVGDLIHRPSGPELKVVSVHWSVDPEVSADVVLLVVPSTTEDYL